MTILAEALRACAGGILTAEAGVSLLIDCGGWLHRDDFTGPFIATGTSISDGTTLMASIDWPAAVTALDAGHLPCGSGERHMLRLAASIAGGVPVSLSDAPDQHRPQERKPPGHGRPARKRANAEQLIQNVT